jgi:hypothetical protein
MSYLNSDNALTLGKLMEEIPNVKQVRFHYVIRDDVIQAMGEKAVVYLCYVESLDQSTAEQIGATVMERFMVIIPENVYEDVNNHGQIQAVMNERIGHYYNTGDIIDRVGPFVYPYSVDADGNKIPYSLEASNQTRN